MSSEWRLARVEEIAAPFSTALATGPFGSAISAKYFVDSGVPVIRGSNLSADTSTRLIDADLAFVSHEKASEFQRSVAKRGDLVFTCWGTINQVGLIDSRSKFDSYIVSNKQMKLTIDPAKADNRFIYYVFSGPAKQNEILENGIGSSVPGFNLGQLKRHEILLPPVQEQKRIADFLETLDDRITLLRETNATLEAIAQALFKSWFVDFDPVRAKAEGRAPEAMDATTAALFPDSFEESELGLVPKGWQHSSVEDFSEKVGMGPFGSNIKVETFVNEGVPVISGQHLRQTLVEDSTFNFITDSHAEKLSNSCVFEGDVIFTHAGSIGQVALLHRHARFDRYVLSQRQFFLRCDKQKMRPEWITYYFRSVQGQHQLLANTSQVGVPSIARPVSYLRSIKVVMPPKAMIDRFSDVADATHQTVLANRVQIQTLTQLRDTLLPRLISGQLRLPEAEGLIEEAV
ncbi:restriction endonuclease subunit S [Balneatrix alpica]|uniref:Restriction endonuclease subunit S n=1 Tax=Balneatrix alpica TaxID=75684 RepID=A0ABV5ZDX2_9GAMM|nr:restriction endonuclease subunit S [Balneatrix alpica]